MISTHGVAEELSNGAALNNPKLPEPKIERKYFCNFRSALIQI